MYLLMLILLVGCDQAAEFPKPQDTLAQFVDFWNEGNYESMYPLLSAASTENYDQEVFTTRYSNISQGIGLTSVTLGGLEVEEDESEATITYSLLFQTNTVPQFTKEYTMMLGKGETHWEVNWDHQHIFPELTGEKSIRVERQLPQRGNIFDNNQFAFAQKGSMREVGLVPGKIENETVLISDLALQLEMSEEKITRLLNQSWVKPDMFVPIKRISEKAWQEKRERLLTLTGIMVNRTEGRVYQMSDALAQTVGYLLEINADQLDTMYQKGYRSGDLVGATGLEAFFEEKLAGTIGFTIAIHDQSGAVELVAQKEVTDGEDVHLTMNAELSAIADAALGRSVGSVVILDAQSGELMALASKPGFDSNLFSLGITSEQYQALEQQDSPFLNRTTAGLYPPGSVFKPFTALMALSEEAFNPEEAWDTPKQWQPDASWGSYHITRVDRPPGPINLLQSIKWSDNVYFADLSLKVGWEPFIQHAQRLGFDAEIPLSLPVKKSSINRSDGRATLLADSGFGQGELQTTPLHMALMYAALARGDGKIPTPQIVTGESPSVLLETSFPVEHITILNRSLQAAVRDPDALAYLGDISLDIRGKTGTGQITSERQIAWFACYFDDVVMVVTIEGDSSLSSSQALQTAKTILKYGF
jgi:penicillin-binding protein